MWCDNQCLGCGEPDESITDANFEYPRALQAWVFLETPSSQISSSFCVSTQTWIISYGGKTILKT